MTGIQLRLRGMRLASDKHRQALAVAQLLAQMLGAQHGRPISIENVYAMGVSPESLGNASGSVFVGGEWTRVGFIKAARPAARARYLSLWRLKICRDTTLLSTIEHMPASAA